MGENTGAAANEAVAAVDLGSNSFHLLVARVSGGQLSVLDRLREMVQLAAGLTSDQRIGRKAQARALECLGRFGQRLKHMPSTSVRAVGTNTLRSAQGVSAFLAAAEDALGHPIETISGMEEARLIFLGVAQSSSNPTARRLVIDIGGGSTELIIGRDVEPLLMESLYLGCVTLSRARFPKGVITADAWEQALTEAHQEFEPVAARFRKLAWDEAIGASGTVRTLDAVVRAQGFGKTGLTLKALKRFRDAAVKEGHVDRLRFEGLSARRRAVIPGGAVVLQAAFEALGIEALQPSDGALREGVLVDLLGRDHERDVRERSVDALAARYDVDREQAARVEATALDFLRQVAADWGIADRDSVRLLTWAARLHEVGLGFAHQQYHKHGEYIVAESDMFGFSRQQQRRLATLIRAHRRKFPGELIGELPHRRRSAERLAVLLRLAALLHRSRNPEATRRPVASVGKRSIRLAFPEGWLDQHPLTRADLQQEQASLHAAGLQLEYA